MGCPFSTDSLGVAGEPFLVTEKGDWPSVSLDHTLVYATTVGKQEQQLVWVDREGGTIGPIGPSLSGLFSPAVSPEDDLIAGVGRDEDRWDIWMYDIGQGSRSRLTFDGYQESHPSWSREGDRIVFSIAQNDSTFVISLATDGTREQETEPGPCPTTAVYNLNGAIGEELFYIRENDLMAVPIRPSARFYTLASFRRLFSIDGVSDNPLEAAYDVTSDGQRIVLVRDGMYTMETTVTVVENLFQNMNSR